MTVRQLRRNRLHHTRRHITIETAKRQSQGFCKPFAAAESALQNLRIVFQHFMARQLLEQVLGH
eukprot:6174444-Pleurochrysis_carterae.AAC.1